MTDDIPPTGAERAAVDRYAQRLGSAPPAVADAAVTTFAARAARRRLDPARVLLVLAGLAGLAIDVPVLLGGASHTTQDVATLHVALAAGLLVAAWRPARYARGMAPVVAIAAVLLFLPAATDPAVTTSAVEELSHLPVIVGAASLLLGRWHAGGRRVRT